MTINQSSQNSSVATGTASAPILPMVTGGVIRTQLILVNTSALAVITIIKGDVAAVQGAGIRLTPNGYYAESSDSGFTCWQGAIQAVSDVAGTVSVVQTLEIIE